MVNGKQKGKAGELEWVNFLKKHGLNAHRTQQYCGANADGDVECKEFPGIHWEVKRVEKLNVLKAIQQATRDCQDRVPVVAHRKNRTPWLITLPAENFVQMLKAFDAATGE